MATKLKLNTWKKRLFFSLTAFFLGFAALKLYFYIGDAYSLSIGCLFHKLTGLYCPGCGGTRTFRALLNLDFPLAFSNNQLLAFIFPILAIYYADKLQAWIRGRETFFAHKIKDRHWIIICILLIIFAVLRNIPALHALRPVP